MSKKTVVAIAILILSPLIIYLIWPSDESRIKKLFREGAKAVESKKIADVMSKVSFNYTDEHGLSYIVLKQGLERVFREMSNIQIEYEIIRIDVKDKTAVAEVDIRVIATYGKETGYFVGDAAKPAHIKFFLDKERTKWYISKTEGLPQDFETR
jgi:hypothetical protein